MSVYVDTFRVIVAREARARRTGAKNQHRWCHMIADSLDELHAMAARIGLRREWFQPASFPHYDLTPWRRAVAVQYGAIEVDRRRLVEVMRAFRARGAA